MKRGRFMHKQYPKFPMKRPGMPNPMMNKMPNKPFPPHHMPQHMMPEQYGHPQDCGCGYDMMPNQYPMEMPQHMMSEQYMMMQEPMMPHMAEPKMMKHEYKKEMDYPYPMQQYPMEQPYQMEQYPMNQCTCGQCNPHQYQQYPQQPYPMKQQPMNKPFYPKD